jgi:hypothetical protein
MMVPSYNELFQEQHPKHSPRIEQILALGGDWSKSVKGMNLGYKCDSTYAIGTGKQSYIDGPGYQAWASRQNWRRALASTAKANAAQNLPWTSSPGFCVTAKGQNVLHYANNLALTADQCKQYCQYDTGCSGFEFFADPQNFNQRLSTQLGGKYNWGYASIQTGVVNG